MHFRIESAEHVIPEKHENVPITAVKVSLRDQTTIAANTASWLIAKTIADAGIRAVSGISYKRILPK